MTDTHRAGDGSARAEILGRIRTALADRPAGTEVAVPWTYGHPVGTGELDIVERFIERTVDYRAIVDRVDAGDVGMAVAAALARAGATTVIADDAVRETCAGEISAGWLTDDRLTPDDLDGIDAVVTTATVAIANTGTIVLDHGPGQGRRATSLVPDVHVCIVTVEQIVGDVPEAVQRLIRSGSHTRPLTWISGPSATSDIELDRVEGVHGPRTLSVIVVG